MKVSTKFFLLLTFTFLFSAGAYAQLSSQHAAGLRFGSATGFNYRYALNDVNAIEGILSVQSNSTSSRFRLVGLYQYHQPINEDFSWYWGYGGSIGSYTRKAFQSQQPDGTINMHPRTSELALSVDGIAGVEYNIPTTPIAVSLDVKPYFDFLQSSSFRIIDTFGFSVRYQF